MYYIDAKGRLIYEMCNMKSEITGFDSDGLFHVLLLWEKQSGGGMVHAQYRC